MFVYGFPYVVYVCIVYNLLTNTLPTPLRTPSRTPFTDTFTNTLTDTFTKRIRIPVVGMAALQCEAPMTSEDVREGVRKAYSKVFVKTL